MALGGVTLPRWRPGRRAAIAAAVTRITPRPRPACRPGAAFAAALCLLAAGRAAATTRACLDDVAQNAAFRTPDPAVNDAFRASLLNLEHTWYQGCGWVESLSGRPTMVTQLPTAAADAVGWQDRSRSCLKAYAEAVTQDGQVLSLSTAGTPRADCCRNHHFIWGVGHYVAWSGDLGFAREVWPVLQRVMRNTQQRFDPDGNHLLGWSHQVGYQEDDVMAPEDCSSSTVAWVRMNDIMADLGRALGRDEEAEGFAREAAAARAALHRDLWSPPLGRFIYWQDELGSRHLEGAWHTFSWPTMFGLLDPLDSYSQLSHLDCTLRTPRGLVYCSNSFPTHVADTSGCQEGSPQSAVCALALARGGQPDAAARILGALGRLVMEPPNAGAWPEVAAEQPAWFSPSAAAFIEAVVEGLFGLQVDRLHGVAHVSPSLPASWPEATLDCPAGHVQVRQSPQERRITVEVPGVERVELSFVVPPGAIEGVTVDGAPAAYDCAPAVGGFRLRCTLPGGRRAEVCVRLQPTPWAVEGPTDVVPGDDLHVAVRGARAVGVVDRAQVLTEARLDGGGLTARVSDDLRKRFSGYGAPGDAVFSDRRFFVECETAGRRFYAAVELTVREPLAVSASPDLEWDAVRGAYVAHLRLQNPSRRDLSGLLRLQALDRTWGGRVQLPPRGAASFPLRLTAADLASATPGLNVLRYELPAAGLSGEATFGVCAPFRDQPELRAALLRRREHVPIPETISSDITRWREFRPQDDLPHPPWNLLREPLSGLMEVPFEPDPRLFVDPATGLTFQRPGPAIGLASWWLDRPEITLQFAGPVQKLYLLLMPLLTNEDAYSEVGELQVRLADNTVLRRPLRFPGDLDWWYPPAVVGELATCGKGWSSSRAIVTSTSVLPIIEVPISPPAVVRSLTLRTVGKYPALGLVAVTLLRPAG